MFHLEISNSPASISSSPISFGHEFKKPPSKIKLLLLEGVSKEAVDMLKEAHYIVDTLPRALSTEELKEKIGDYHVLGVRSKTKVTEEVLQCAKRLLCIGCFCIGTDQCDLEAAQKRGIPVFNSPFQNSRSVAELIISMIIALARQLGDRNMEMHNKKWNKTSKNCFEVRGKVLGIIGYGHIGSQLSVLAEAMGLDVRYYDIETVMPLGNSTCMKTLDSLLECSDFVTLHVPDTPQTRNMITEREISLMKKGSYLLNASRGCVVDIPALAAALKSGHLGGAYIDVFPEEPQSNTNEFYQELQGCPNTILTPHIGGSTTEAQTAIGREVAGRFIAYLESGSTAGSVNFPEISVPMAIKTHRICNVHVNTPGVLKSINNILSEFNVERQVLLTKGSIGYLIADVEQEASDLIKQQISELPTSIKTRILY